ncbi:MAG: DUF4158 domain-containing protein [Planctomycetaceae bacterium]|jgi:hypothetical protein|nr:DUF4158 domain-containing protein [Planctomycetaceae bacterium]
MVKMITRLNPYHAPVTKQVLVEDGETLLPRRRSTNWFGFAVQLAFFRYPVWVLAAFCVTWLIAWVQLGHQPRPMLDDPKSIGGFSDDVYMISGMFVILMPALAPLGLVAAFLCPVFMRRGVRGGLNAGLMMLYVLLAASAILMLGADPGHVVEWWFD